MDVVVTGDEYGLWFLINFLMVQKESLSHQGYLIAYVLGQYPSLHGAGKIANYLTTTDNSLVFLIGGNLVNPVGVVSLFSW